MPDSKQRKDRTRQRILASACRLFPVRGYAAVSIDEIMREAGLTRGGFYYHFSSKQQLYREAIEAAARKRRIHACFADEEWIAALLDELAVNATSARDAGLAFLATDLRRTEDEVRSAYTRALLEMDAAHIRAGAGEDASLAVSAMIIGAAALIQTTDDEQLKGRLFTACRQGARRLLNGSLPPRLSYFWATADN